MSFNVLRPIKLFIRRQIEIIGTSKLSILGGLILSFFFILAIVGPYVAPYDPYSVDRDSLLSPPSKEHLFGTSYLGRDILSQVIVGTKATIVVGLTAAIITVSIGFMVGLVSGYFGGYLDEVLMRLTDLAYSLPMLPFILVLSGMLRPSMWNVIMAIAILQWRAPARVIRSEVMSISHRAYIKAAKISGASSARIIFVHIAPNVLSLLFLYLSVVTGWAILTEATVSFLGFGDPSVITWGKMLQTAFVTGSLRTAWWWVVPPGISIMVLVLSVFLLSLAYEEVTNPRLKGY